MKKNALYIFVIAVIASCSVSKTTTQDVTGIYTTNYPDVNGEISLKKDHTFIYKYSGGLIKTESKGNWEIAGQSILMTSNKEYLSNTIIVDEFTSREKTAIHIKNSDSKISLPAVIFFNNEEKGFEVDQSGIFNIPSDKNIESFKIHYLGEVYQYIVKSKGANNFEVTVYISDLSKTYFNNEKLKIKNNNLIAKSGMKFIKNKI